MRQGNNSRRHHRSGGGRSGGGHGGHSNHSSHTSGNVSSGSNNTGRRFNPRIQTFDSNGPDVRIRGNAFQVNEKYLSMARDVAAAGDRVLAESYLQHAEHYQRMLNEAAIEFGDHQPSQQQQQQQPSFNNNNGGNAMDMAGSEQPEVNARPMNGQEEIPAPVSHQTQPGNEQASAQDQGGGERRPRPPRPPHRRAPEQQQPTAENPPEAETA